MKRGSKLSSLYPNFSVQGGGKLNRIRQHSSILFVVGKLKSNRGNRAKCTITCIVLLLAFPNTQKNFRSFKVCRYHHASQRVFGAVSVAFFCDCHGIYFVGREYLN